MRATEMPEEREGAHRCGTAGHIMRHYTLEEFLEISGGTGKKR